MPYIKSSLLLLCLLPLGIQANSAVSEACLKISNKLSSVQYQECMDSQLKDSGFRSHDNNSLLIKEYLPVAGRTPQARILILGGIHGDEYSSVSVSFKWMNILNKHHSGLFHWQVAPLVNPDGLLRKKSQRTNSNGVDLNRNFSPGDKMQTSLDYWRDRTHSDKRRYPGPFPLSETETRWVESLITEFNPDAIISIHAPYGILDFDGPHKAPQHFGPLHLKLLGTYPGSLGNYAGLQLGKPVITIELPYAGIMPSKSQISKIWTDLVRWLRNNVESDDYQQRLALEQASQ